MRKPKYSVGTKVKHISANKWGVIVGVFPSHYEKGHFYEWRYLVNHSRFTWSVAERYLDQ